MKLRILSRVAFCQNCYDKRDPHDGQFYFVHGSTTGKVWRMRHDAPTNREQCTAAGFTPHFFEVERLLPDGNLSVRVSCGMQGCDTQYRYNDKKQECEYLTVCEHYIAIPPKEWEALETFTNTGYEL